MRASDDMAKMELTGLFGADMRADILQPDQFPLDVLQAELAAIGFVEKIDGDDALIFIRQANGLIPCPFASAHTAINRTGYMLL